MNSGRPPWNQGRWAGNCNYHEEKQGPRRKVQRSCAKQEQKHEIINFVSEKYFFCIHIIGTDMLKFAIKSTQERD